MNVLKSNLGCRGECTKSRHFRYNKKDNIKNGKEEEIEII